MKETVKKDFDWQMALVPKAQAILDELPMRLFAATKVAPRQVDIHRNGDLVLIPFGGKLIALRLRRPGFMGPYGLQITIRTSRDSGAETELSKIQRGLGDWFFYGHIELGWSSAGLIEQLRHWVIIDLSEFREWLTDQRISAAWLINNKDGTYGRAFEIKSIASMIVAESETMRFGLEHGMQAIQPLPSGPPRRTTFPPALADLIEKYGGWHMIPQDAWMSYDEKCAAWYAAHRVGDNVIL